MPASPEMRRFLNQRVVVHFDGPAIDGVVVSLGVDSLLLQPAEFVDSDGSRRPMSGSVLVDRSRSLFIQIPDPEAS